MFYRQFGDIASPTHCFKDKEGNLIPISAGSSGGSFLNRKNSFAQSSSGSFSGPSRQSFFLRKSFGVPTSGTSDATDSTSQSNYGGEFPSMKRGSFSGSGSLNDFSTTKRGSFGAGNSSRQKLLTRTSISTTGGNSVYGGGDSASLNGDVSVRTEGPTNRSITRRSMSQVISSVRVKSFLGGGPAPRLVKLVQTSTSTADIAKSRYIAEHENDVETMQLFFRRSGLSMQKSIVCAEEAICLDANSPRKLFKYVHEVSGFSLMNLGMDRIDAELVLESLNDEFSHKDISAANAAAAAVAKMIGGSFSTSPMGSVIGNYNDSKPVTISMIEDMKPEESSRARRIAEHEDDVLNMMEFFRFSGLGIKQSRECAEQSICMDANSPRKLFKYLQEVKGFYLTDLSMDALEADMVLKTLMREFGTSLESSSNNRGKVREHRKNSLSSIEYDYKSDSSKGYNSRSDLRPSPIRNPGGSKVHTADGDATFRQLGRLTQRTPLKAPLTAPPTRMTAFASESSVKARAMLDTYESRSPDAFHDNDRNESYIEYKEEEKRTIYTLPAPSFSSSEIIDTGGTYRVVLT